MGPKLLLLFIVGDILGTGIYALTGQVAAEVGGAAWVPFLVAFGVALLTAFSYLELVTKYPQAAGAALYTHKAFGIHFVTFIICFTVMCSGITSASTASRAFAANLAKGLGITEPAAGPHPRRRARLHGPGHAGELPRRRRERQGQRRAHPGRAVRPGAGHRGRDLRDHRRPRRLVAGGRVRHPGRQERVPRRHHRDLARVLRDGRLRGLGEHGRGDQGPLADLPEGDADGPDDHRDHLRPGVDLRGRAGAARRARRQRHPAGLGGRGGRPGLPDRATSSRSSRCSPWRTPR